MTTETLRLTRVHFRSTKVQTNRTGAAAAADVADFKKLEDELNFIFVKLERILPCSCRTCT